MRLKDLIIRGVKCIYRKIVRKKFYHPVSEFNRQRANDIIYEELSSSNPCMISRVGCTELNCINNYLTVYSERNIILKILDYIMDWTQVPWWNESHFQAMSLLSGIFPPCKETAIKFSEIYLRDIPQIDVLGSFHYQEKWLPLSLNVKKVHLETMYPFFVDRPWTRVLKNKKVLIVHPFVETIKFQYQNKSQLFETEILPDFELVTLKAIQTIAGVKTEFISWFDALEYMKKEISKIDFDIALLGCGAYGLPLAAYIKSLGKKSVHLGGGLQLLFGIKGKRWTEQYEECWEVRPGVKINTNYKVLFNDKWVFPSEEEKPQNAEIVENACYW